MFPDRSAQAALTKGWSENKTESSCTEKGLDLLRSPLPVKTDSYQLLKSRIKLIEA
jgi:hypothetical protein